MSNKSLKSQNLPKIWTFILLNIILAYCFLYLKEVNLDNIQTFYQKLTGRDSFVIVISPLITLFLNNLLSSNFKAKIVFWRIRNPLPGTRVFSKLLFNDQRIDEDILVSKYGELPTNPNAQNKLWYKLLKKNEENVIIRSSHKNYLLLRDISGISFFLFTIYIPIYLVFYLDMPYALFFLIYLFLQYIGFAVSSQNTGKRFVLNVLAVDSLINKN